MPRRAPGPSAASPWPPAGPGKLVRLISLRRGVGQEPGGRPGASQRTVLWAIWGLGRATGPPPTDIQDHQDQAGARDPNLWESRLSGSSATCATARPLPVSPCHPVTKSSVSERRARARRAVYSYTGNVPGTPASWEHAGIPRQGKQSSRRRVAVSIAGLCVFGPR